MWRKEINIHEKELCIKLVIYKDYTFERVGNFKYLVVILNEDNNHQIYLKDRTKNANKTYFVLQKVFRNKNISKKN